MLKQRSNVSVSSSQSSHGIFSIALSQLLKIESSPRTSSMQIRGWSSACQSHPSRAFNCGGKWPSWQSGLEESKAMVGWHWHVFALHLEAHFSSILDSGIHVVRTAILLAICSP